MTPLVVLAEDIGPEVARTGRGCRTTPTRSASALMEHIELTVLAVLFGLLIALPLALLSVRYRRLYGPVIAITGVLYTIPSLALFALLLPLTGLSRTTALIPLTAYTLLILVRNTVTGLDGVPPDVKEAAVGMGYSRRRQLLLRVELPLALPAIIAGIRIATVTHHRLWSPSPRSSARAGSGTLMLDGFQRDFQHAAHRRHRAVARARRRRRPAARARAARSHAVARAGRRWRRKGRPRDGLLRRRLRLPHQRATSGTATRRSPACSVNTCSSRVVSVLVAALVALPDRHPARPRAHGWRDRGQHRQHRPRAARVRAADPRGAVGRHRRSRPASSRPVQSVPAFIAMFALAVPPMVANAYVGMASVDDEIRESARGMGMNGRQMIWRVELPNAMPLIMAGVRTATVAVVATATLAALRRLRRLRPLHRRRLRGARQRQGLRRRPARRAARHRARAAPRAACSGAITSPGHPLGGEGEGAATWRRIRIAPTGRML